MKKVLFVFVCCASVLFAQSPEAAVAPVPCRASFEAIKNVFPRDAAANRMYATVEARIHALEAVPKDERKGLFESEERSCELSVELLKAQLERVALGRSIDSLNKANIAALKEISKVKDTLINLYVSDAKSLSDAFHMERERLESLNREKEKQLAEKDSLLAAQKAEAEKKLDALRSKTINVYRDARGTILSMSDILFETGKADLKTELKENLAEIAAILKNLLTDSNVEVEGHTDNVGSEAFNKDLSERRASGVLNYLAERGVDKKRLKSIGYGLKKPIADNNTEEGRAKNRRVELVIKDK